MTAMIYHTDQNHYTLSDRDLNTFSIFLVWSQLGPSWSQFSPSSGKKVILFNATTYVDLSRLSQLKPYKSHIKKSFLYTYLPPFFYIFNLLDIYWDNWSL